jgi:hypothetical protein
MINFPPIFLPFIFKLSHELGIFTLSIYIMFYNNLNIKCNLIMMSLAYDC